MFLAISTCSSTGLCWVLGIVRQIDRDHIHVQVGYNWVVQGIGETHFVSEWFMLSTPHAKLFGMQPTTYCVVNSTKVNINSDFVILLSELAKSVSKYFMVHSNHGIVTFRIWQKLEIQRRTLIQELYIRLNLWIYPRVSLYTKVESWNSHV